MNGKEDHKEQVVPTNDEAADRRPDPEVGPLSEFLNWRSTLVDTEEVSFQPTDDERYPGNRSWTYKEMTRLSEDIDLLTANHWDEIRHVVYACEGSSQWVTFVNNVLKYDCELLLPNTLWNLELLAAFRLGRPPRIVGEFKEEKETKHKLGKRSHDGAEGSEPSNKRSMEESSVGYGNAVAGPSRLYSCSSSNCSDCNDSCSSSSCYSTGFTSSTSYDESDADGSSDSGL